MVTSSKGLIIWDLSSDRFDHTQLAANFNLLDGWIGKAQYAETLSALPSSGNFAGRLVMLNTANAGFPAWTLVRYNGSAWQNAGAIEVLPTVPTLSNYSGRIVVLSADDSGFLAWEVIRYNGTTWEPVGGFKAVNTGALSTNIVGRRIDADIYVGDATRGIVLVDRTGGTKRRVFINNGTLSSETVT